MMLKYLFRIDTHALCAWIGKSAMMRTAEKKVHIMNRMNAEKALARLKEGSRRYISSSFNPGNISREIRIETAEHGQHPYAVIVACSDSREIPEDIFTCGIGEIFTIRVAGNVIADNQLGSIEYAVEHLGIELVVVLGHTGCGAVGASLKGETGGHVGSITRDIIQAIGNEKKALEASILNTVYQAHKVKEAFPDVTTVPALYDIHSGEIIWLE